MRVVVDTNVFINALFKEDQWCLKILTEESRGTFQFVFNDSTSTELFVIVTEILETKNADKGEKYRILNRLLRIITRSINIERKTLCSLCQLDTNDNKFIGCAIDGKAEFIISENGTHLNENLEPLIKKEYNCSVSIVNAFQFHKLLLQRKFNSHNAK